MLWNFASLLRSEDMGKTLNTLQKLQKISETLQGKTS